MPEGDEDWRDTPDYASKIAVIGVCITPGLELEEHFQKQKVPVNWHWANTTNNAILLCVEVDAARDPKHWAFNVFNYGWSVSKQCFEYKGDDKNCTTRSRSAVTFTRVKR